MPENWENLSEIVSGLCVRNKLSPEYVKPELFSPPYDEVVILCKQGKNTANDIVGSLGVNIYETVTQAADSLNGSHKTVDWVGLLEKSYQREILADQFDRAQKKLRTGTDPDFSKISAGIKRLAHHKLPIRAMSEIEPRQERFIESGWPVWDKHVIGLPYSGLLTIGAAPGIGKTTTLLKLVDSFTKTHTDKTAFIASLEMPEGELVQRFLEIARPVGDQMDRIKVFDKVTDIYEIANAAASVENIGLFGIDYSDKCIQGQIDEQKMAEVYDVAGTLAKNLEIPGIMLSQISRHDDSVPKMHHLRYTSRAEAESWMIAMLYNPRRNPRRHQVSELPYIKGNRAYIIFWKIRGGFRNHIQDNPGAISIKWSDSRGWHNSEEYGWVPLID